MKIVRYYPRFHVGDGGISNAVRGWSRSLSRAGAEVVVVFDDHGPGGDLGGAVTVPISHIGSGRLRVPTNIGEVLEGADIIVLHSGWTLHNVVVARAARVAGVPFMLEPRGAYDPHIFERRKIAKQLWWAGLERNVVHAASAVHVFFQQEEPHLRRLRYDGRLVVAPNGVEVPPEASWDGGRDDFILWMGRFDPEHKGLDLLVEAVGGLKAADRPAIRLHGPDWRNSKQRLRDEIRARSLESWITIGDAAYGAAKWDLFRAAKAFVYPSRWEGFGISLGEAAALGIPVVVTPYPFGSYLAARGGAFLAERSAPSLGRALLDATAPEGAAVGRRAAAIVRDDFAWDRALMARAGRPSRRRMSSMPAAPPWLTLLVNLTETSQGWAVWKNVDAALSGDGDIDSTAPRSAWPAIEGTFQRWATEHGFGPAIVCRHIPGGLNLIALLPEANAFVELGVKDRRVYRGATLFRPEQLAGMLVMDDRGFRRLRSGAEGFVKLLLNGLRIGGRRNDEGLRRKNVVELIRGDVEGARSATFLVGRARPAALTAIDSLLAGDWDRTAMLTIEARMISRALAEPHVLFPRLWFRAVTKRSCPVVRAMLFDDRTISGRRDEWLRDVARGHWILGSR